MQVSWIQYMYVTYGRYTLNANGQSSSKEPSLLGVLVGQQHNLTQCTILRCTLCSSMVVYFSLWPAFIVPCRWFSVSCSSPGEERMTCSISDHSTSSSNNDKVNVRCFYYSTVLATSPQRTKSLLCCTLSCCIISTI